MRVSPYQKGLSLVELIIALALSGILSLALFEVFNVARASFKQVVDANESLDGAQLSFALLQDSINMGGFWGGVDSSEIELLSNHLTAFPGDCDSDWVLNINLGIEGFDGRENTNNIPDLPKGCLGDDYVPNSDVLVVRRASVLDPISEEKLDNKYYKKRYIVRGSAGGRGVIFRGNKAKLAQKRINESTAVVNRLLSIDMYYLEYCRDIESCDESGLGLSRYTLSGSRFVKQRLVNGVAQMQFEYGIDVDGNGQIDRYARADQVLDWKNAKSVRVFILLKGKSRTGGYKNRPEAFLLGEHFILEESERESQYKYKKFQSEFSLRNS